jgi:chorismate synthase
MQEAIAEAKKRGDSLGGIIECAVTGLPVGLGGPMFDGVEGKIAHAMYGIPAVKGVDFGLGFANTYHPGSQTNDAYILAGGHISSKSNHCGGILGGITNGMPVIFRVTVKPTPSIAKVQQSVSVNDHEIRSLTIHGRHDPCIVPRAVPVVEAAAAIVAYDLILGNTQTSRRK